MDRKITELYILTGVFCALIICTKSISTYEVIVNICYVSFLILIQLSKSIFKVNKYICTAMEALSIILFKYFGAIAVELFMPIVIYEIFNAGFMNFIAISIFIIADFLFFKGEAANFVIFSVLVNLYLYEGDKQYKIRHELKLLNKLQSARGYMLKEKMKNMHNLIKQKDTVAALRERNYMAQKVHDHLGHRITSSIMQLEVTKETLGKDNELSRKYLLTAMDSLRCGMEEVRGFLKNAKPGEKVISIEDIKKQLLEFQYSTNIKTHMDINGDVKRLKIEHIKVILENLREALTNTAKYSEASNIYFSINIYNKFARVEVRDDGKGSEGMSKNLGLRGMEERVEKIGGKIQFYNDNGFVINMIINI